MRNSEFSGDVPCDGCKLCCKGDMIRLLDQDNPSLYKTERHPLMTNSLMLAHKPNGNCYYLTGNGCSIHDYKPAMCREMDCRVIFQRIPSKAAKKYNKVGLLDIKVWRQGRLLSKFTGVK